MRTLLALILITTTAACAHTQTEREVYRDGIHEGFAMGHAPQILPVQVQPVAVNTIAATQAVFPEAQPAAAYLSPTSVTLTSKEAQELHEALWQNVLDGMKQGE